jgi:hypothetical protein
LQALRSCQISPATTVTPITIIPMTVNMAFCPAQSVTLVTQGVQTGVA